MITLTTNHPIATESLDHKHPEGIYYDNNFNQWWYDNLIQYYGTRNKIKLLDLGCAGGLLVRAMHEYGHLAVGLEGSDHCLNIRPEMVSEVGKLPAGHENWQLYGKKILFTCDVTKEYDILDDGVPIKFDLVTCWDVIEHFEPHQLDTYFEQVVKHLRPGGLFIATIALAQSGRAESSKNTPTDINYHRSIFSAEWWKIKLGYYFNQIDYPFGHCYNRIIDGGSLVYAGTTR